MGCLLRRSIACSDARARAAHAQPPSRPEAIQERCPVLLGAGVGLTHVDEVMSAEERYAGQVFLRELSVCICGEDLRPGLPRTKPGPAVAAGFHRDTPAVLARARSELAGSTDPEVIRRACRVASRRMVQAAFAVVMARDGVWATVLEEQAAAVGKAFPEWAEAARRAAEQGRQPVADARVVVMDVILIPGFWFNAASWEGVVPALEAAGHRVRALTLPGLASIDDDRAGVGLAD